MNKSILKSTIVLTLVGVACGLLIGLANLITAPIIKENNLKIARKAYEEFFSDLDQIELEIVDGKYVYEYVKVLNKDEEVIGHAFRAKDSNQRGLIDIVVAADVDGKILGVKILSTENTPGFYDLYENNNKFLIGVNGNTLDELDGINNISGATQTGNSLNAILREVGEVAGDYVTSAPITLNEYEKLFGLGATSEVDNDFVGNETVTKKENVYDEDENLVGFAYTGTITVTNIPGKASAALTLLAGIKLDGTVAGVVTINKEHTPGFYDDYEDGLNNLAGWEIDLIAGATISHDAINAILSAIKPFAESDVKLYNYVRLFGNNITVENDETFTTTEVITKKEVVKDAVGNIVGYAYTGTTTVTNIPGKGSAKLTLLVGVKVNDEVAGVITVLREHTPGYYDDYEEGLNKLNAWEIDLITGATISRGAINNILDAIKGVVIND